MTDYDIDFGASDVPPYIKFNAKTNLWAVNRGTEEEAIEQPRMLIDLEHIQKGWLRFREQMAPDFKLDPRGTPMDTLVTPEPGTGDYKTGFIVQIFSTALGSRQLSANSFQLKEAIGALYRQYKKESPAHPGKLPICEVIKVETITGNYGANFRPTFSIIGWADRPAEFCDHLPKGSAQVAVATPQPAPAQSAQVVSITAQKPLDDTLDDSIPF